MRRAVLEVEREFERQLGRRRYEIMRAALCELAAK
jgi:hypothetical protein